MKKLLYLTDLSYQAKGRRYCDEDIYLASLLKDRFDVVLCHPKCSESFENTVDLVIFRNTGGVSGFPDIYRSFVRRVKENHIKTFNTFTGKADMRGKQYLLDLTRENYPVIPTIDTTADLPLLPDTDRYVIKPKDGADSIGLEFLTRAELQSRRIIDGTMLIQPAIDFLYEVSFYFINDKFEYALYAPDTSKRWALEPYPYTDEDIAFAERFIRWNTIESGIQRVDACKTKDGRLLLVELEDLNPYLSLSQVDKTTRDRFTHDLIRAIESAVNA